MQLLIRGKPMGKWDARFCELSKFIANWSKDPKAKVGAIVVLQRGGVISTGYNGFPMGVEDSAERLDDSNLKLELIVHAEQNALINAGPKAEGATIYVWGKPICTHCAGSIIQAGIKRVVTPGLDSLKQDSKWLETGEWALQMFKEAKVKVDLYTVT